MKMIEPKTGPFDYSVLTYIWVMALAALGGIVSFYGKVKSGAVRAFNFTELAGELFTSGFAGLLTFWLCRSANMNEFISAVLIGISGHMGSRAIFAIEKWATEKFGASNDAGKTG